MDDAVNVHTRAIRAAERTNNGHGPIVDDPPQLSWWRNYFRWENLTVAGRNIEKGWVVPQPIGVALIIVILGAVGWAYRANTVDARETRDAIIEMKTMLNERTHSFEREQDKLQQKLDSEVKVAQLQREQQNDKIRALQTQRASR